MKRLQFPIPRSNQRLVINLSGVGIVVAILLITNVLSLGLVRFFKGEQAPIEASVAAKDQYRNSSTSVSSDIYLLNYAQEYIHDANKFGKKANAVARQLNLPVEWLMAVIYSESKFDAAAQNTANGAVGLIQFKPDVLRQLNISTSQLQNLSPIEQLTYVQRYFENMQKDRKVKYDSVTDLYIAALYPDALGEDYCYTLYHKPEAEYTQNIILDEDKDGRVTVKDVDDRMKRMFPTAYMTEKDKVPSWWQTW